jgi:hypothetical protein
MNHFIASLLKTTDAAFRLTEDYATASVTEVKNMVWETFLDEFSRGTPPLVSQIVL